MLSNYADRGEQVNWWPAFVQAVLGKPTSMRAFELGTTDPVYRKASER